MKVTHKIHHLKGKFVGQLRMGQIFFAPRDEKVFYYAKLLGSTINLFCNLHLALKFFQPTTIVKVFGIIGFFSLFLDLQY